MPHVRGERPSCGRTVRLAPTRRVPHLALWGLWLVILLPGCIGPRSLELTRLRYDQAVHETSEQQWLRNIVRLRYGDLPSFLDVSAITSQFELSSRGGITGGQERDSPNQSLFGDMSLQFRDAPTLSYTPRDPTELTRAMVAPVGITALGLMANNGWGLDDVLRLMVADVNGLENAPGAEQFLPETVPHPTPFDEVARLAGHLRRERAIVLASVEVPKAVSPPIAADRVDGSDLVQAANSKLEYRAAENATSWSSPGPSRGTGSSSPPPRGDGPMWTRSGNCCGSRRAASNTACGEWTCRAAWNSCRCPIRSIRSTSERGRCSTCSRSCRRA